MDKDGALHIGKIVGVHGIKGYLKLYSLMESTDLFGPGKRVRIRLRGGEMKEYTVVDLQPYKNLYRIAFEGVEDRDAASALDNAGLFIDRAALPPPGTDSWYWCDLIGLKVYQLDDTYIGRIENIFATGANDVFVVKQGEKEVLIPAIKTIVKDVDLDRKKMTVELPEGL